MAHATRAEMLKAVLTSPIYIIITLVGVAIYYEMFRLLILHSNSGVFLVTVPLYLIYALVVTAGLLLAISIFAAKTELRKLNPDIESGVLSVLTPTIAGVVASCGCQFSVLGSILYLFGLGIVQATNIVLLVNSYQAPIIVAFIALNLILIYYNLGRMAGEHTIKRGKR